MSDSIKNRAFRQIPLWILLVFVPLLQSKVLIDQGLLIRFIGLQTVMLLFLGVLLVQKKKLQQFSSQLLLIYFFFVAYTGLHLFFGNVFSDSVFEWFKIASYFLLLVLLFELYSFKEFESTLPVILSALGIILAVLGTIELFQSLGNGKFNIPLDTYQIKTVFGHRNIYLQVLFLTFPFQVYRSLKVRKITFQWVYAVFSSLTFFLLIVLSNRAVWLALLFGILTLTLFIFLQRKKIVLNEMIVRREIKFIIIPLFATLMASGLFFIFLTETVEVEKHLSDIVKIENGSGKDRLELWKRTVKLIEEKPLLGYGAANWKIEVLKYGSRGLVSEDNITFYQRPHNDFLWTFSEYGVIGGLLYLMLFLWTFVSLLKQLFSSKQIKSILFYYAVFYALLGFAVFSFFSFPHERIVHNILLTTFFAIIISGKDNQTHFHKQKVSKSVFFLISIVFIVSSLYFGYQRFISESHLSKALVAKADKHHLVVIDEIEKAISPYYVMDPISTPLCWYKGVAYYETGQVDSALKYFLKAYELNPYHVHVMNNLASAYGKKGEVTKAIDFYTKALKIYPEFEESSFNLCAVYFNNGQTDSALEVIKTIDLETENPKFKTFIKVVLKEKIIEILKDRGKENMIGDLPDDKETYYQLFKTIVAKDLQVKNLIFDSSDFSEIINPL